MPKEPIAALMRTMPVIALLATGLLLGLPDERVVALR